MGASRSARAAWQQGQRRLLRRRDQKRRGGEKIAQRLRKPAGERMLYSRRRGLDGGDFKAPVHRGQHIFERLGRGHKHFLNPQRGRAHRGEGVGFGAALFRQGLGQDGGRHKVRRQDAPRRANGRDVFRPPRCL